MGSAILAKLIRRDAVRAAMSAAVGAEVREAAKGGSFPQIGDHTTRTASKGLSRICGVGLAPARVPVGPRPARRADTPRTNTHNARKALAYTADVKDSTPIPTSSLRFPPQSRILPRRRPPRDLNPSARSVLGAAGPVRARPLQPLRTSRPPPFPQPTPLTPPRTYFPLGDCVLPQTTGDGPQSSAGHRSPRGTSTFPISSIPAEADSEQNPSRRRRAVAKPTTGAR